MRTTEVLMALAAILATGLVEPANAVERRSPTPLLYHRTAVSGFYGYGIPVGEFADSREGYGNHEEGARDWAVEIEHFAGRTTSLGFSIANTTYEDKSDSTLETQLTTLSGFVRIVVPTATAIRPYLRFGMGGVQLEFLDPVAREDADWAFSVQGGGGLLWLPARWLGINAQALYYWGSTDDSVVYTTPTEIVVVGFDTSYWALSAGVSLFFP
jgi:hypothetical protein